LDDGLSVVQAINGRVVAPGKTHQEIRMFMRGQVQMP
jgi:hypothetical protein